MQRGYAATILVLFVAVVGFLVSRASESAGQQQIRHFRKGAASLPSADLLSDQTRILLEGDVSLASREFPANRWYDYNCGGSLVWENVLLTAGHCVFADPTITVLVSGVRARCTVDNQYTAPGEPHDIAVCLIASPISEPLYETVDLSATPATVGDPIMLTGFAGNARDPSGVDLMGVTSVESVGGGTIVTRGGTWVIKGDSGSPSFSWGTPSARRLIAVNSDMATGARGAVLSVVGSSASFLSRWTTKHDTKICGLNGFSHSRCRP